MLTMNVFTCIGLFCLVATVCAQFKSHLQNSRMQKFQRMHVAYVPPETPPPTETSPYCSNGTCAGVSYEEILELYGDLFFTKEELQNLSGKNNAIDTVSSPKISFFRRKRLVYMYPPAHDGDRCCPTYSDFLQVPTMTDIYGLTYPVVQLTDNQPFPMFQLVQRGQCIYKRTQTCNKCREESAYHQVLVIDFASITAPLKFKIFRIPSYCSCKG